MTTVEDSPVGHYLLDCNKLGGTAKLKSEILDQTRNTHYLLTLDVLHIWREKRKKRHGVMNSGAGN